MYYDPECIRGVLEPSKASTMELFAKIVNGLIVNSYRLGSKYASVYVLFSLLPTPSSWERNEIFQETRKILLYWVREISVDVSLDKTEAATRSVLWKTSFKNFGKFLGKQLCQNLFFHNFAVWGQRRRSGVFFVNFEQISHFILVFLFLSLNM